MTDHQIIENFHDAISAVGLTPPMKIVADGKIHRFSTNGKRKDDAGRYSLYLDGVPAGWFMDWRTDVRGTWCAKSSQTMSTKEREAHRQRMEAIRQQREEEEQQRHADAAKLAQEIWASAKPATDAHPYLQRKNVSAHGLRVDRHGRLIAAIFRNASISSLQSIDENGEKRFTFGGAIRGGMFVIGDLANADLILEAEGYATGATLYEITGLPVVIAFNAGNLEPVAKQLRAKYPTDKIVICADNDFHADGKPNTGLLAAEKAVNAINGILAVPPVLDNRPTDWNDVFVKQGVEAVKQAFQAVLPLKATPDSGETMDDSDTGLETGHAATDSLNGEPPEATILDQVYAFLGQFVAYPSEEAQVAHTLWIAHTHLMDKWDSTPRIAFLSPEPGSGKTRALEITETLVPRPIEAINATPAYLFRKISDPAGLPTVLYDEIDTLFGPRAKENEELRGVINAGHRPGAQAGKCVPKGKQIETEEFPAYCAVAMAGLGNLPDTILSRSVIIRMRRRAPNEQVSPYRRKVHGPKGNTIRKKIEIWADEVRETIETSPQLPEGIVDRNADVWESLVSVADAVGGVWPKRARDSAVTLVSASADERGSLGLRLLTDIRTVFGDAKALFTVDLLTALHTLEESPWNDLKGRPLDANRLATLLKPYGVKSRQVRIGEESKKGYHQDDLIDAWTRYLTPGPPLSSPNAETDETTDTLNPSLYPVKGETNETQETLQDPEEVAIDEN